MNRHIQECEQIGKEADDFWTKLGEPKRGRRPSEARGRFNEIIVKTWLRELLGRKYNVNDGAIVDDSGCSPHCDIIVYKGKPISQLLGKQKYEQCVLVRPEQVKFIGEVKSAIDTPNLFGSKIKKGVQRDKKSGLIEGFKERKKYFSGKYVLFVLELYIGKRWEEKKILKRLTRVSDMFVVIWKRGGDRKGVEYDFRKSYSKFKKYVKSL